MTKDYDERLQQAARTVAEVFSPRKFELLYMGQPRSKGPKLAKPASHPAWDVNGQVVYAKDEKTALKYAKKRGLWHLGIIVKPVKQN